MGTNSLVGKLKFIWMVSFGAEVRRTYIVPLMLENTTGDIEKYS